MKMKLLRSILWLACVFGMAPSSHSATLSNPLPALWARTCGLFRHILSPTPPPEGAFFQGSFDKKWLKQVNYLTDSQIRVRWADLGQRSVEQEIGNLLQAEKRPDGTFNTKVTDPTFDAFNTRVQQAIVLYGKRHGRVAEQSKFLEWWSKQDHYRNSASLLGLIQNHVSFEQFVLGIQSDFRQPSVSIGGHIREARARIWPYALSAGLFITYKVSDEVISAAREVYLKDPVKESIAKVKGEQAQEHTNLVNHAVATNSQFSALLYGKDFTQFKEQWEPLQQNIRTHITALRSNLLKHSTSAPPAKLPDLAVYDQQLRKIWQDYQQVSEHLSALQTELTQRDPAKYYQLERDQNLSPTDAARIKEIREYEKQIAAVSFESKILRQALTQGAANTLIRELYEPNSNQPLRTEAAQQKFWEMARAVDEDLMQELKNQTEYVSRDLSDYATSDKPDKTMPYIEKFAQISLDAMNTQKIRNELMARGAAPSP